MLTLVIISQFELMRKFLNFCRLLSDLRIEPHDNRLILLFRIINRQRSITRQNTSPINISLIVVNMDIRRRIYKTVHYNPFRHRKIMIAFSQNIEFIHKTYHPLNN